MDLGRVSILESKKCLQKYNII